MVKNTNYNNKNNIPVLTAGKSFILGYTNESESVFKKNLPVIIFDDFTTATQFISFPFKVKSSAIKILIAKDNKINIKIVYELMQAIKFIAYNHKRYWISEYQELEIKLPPLKEQQKIADFLSLWDSAIDKQKQLITDKEKFKKGLMQLLLTGKIRFTDDNGKPYPAWQVVKLCELLNYKRPSKYMVKNTNYNNKNNIPVLTAGKSFILGYTNESEGVFKKNLPVIIFDDFTTATQFISFPFKVKSAAIKILIAKIASLLTSELISCFPYFINRFSKEIF